MKKLKLHGFNNLTKSLSFCIYDICYAKTAEERDGYIAYIDELYNANRLTEILTETCSIIGANILNIARQDYEPQGASVTILVSEEPVDPKLIDQTEHPGPLPETVVAHLDKSHICVHTYPESHPEGDMGEDPQGIPNNLMPYIAQVAVGRRESLAIFGNDYPTEDGTGVRDYIHVMDLADGHVAAMEKLADKAGVHIYNLGAGVGSSVLDVVNAFSKACGKPINYHFAPRRSATRPSPNSKPPVKSITLARGRSCRTTAT